MMNPEVLLLDEPSAGLSPVLQDQVFARAREINRSGVAVIMVEQNARRCLQICHRGYVLDHGRNAYTGTGRSLLKDPKVIEPLPGHPGPGRLSSPVPGSGLKKRSGGRSTTGPHFAFVMAGRLPGSEDVFVECRVGFVASAVGGDAEAGCGGFAGFYELVGSAHAVVVGVATAIDDVLALREADALESASGHAVDLRGDLHRVVRVGDQRGQRHDDDRVIGLRAVGIDLLQTTLVGAVQPGR